MRCSKCRCELRIVHVSQKPDALVYQYACKNRQCPAFGKVAEERERDPGQDGHGQGKTEA